MTRSTQFAALLFPLLVVLGCGSDATGTGGGSTSTTSTTSSGGGSGGALCVPIDDGNPCTDDTCDGGVAVHIPAAAGSPCSMGGALCDGMGACVECLVPADCAGMDDACQTRTCVQGMCGVELAAAGTLVPMQTAGDCKVEVCDGNGGTSTQNDDADFPDDKNACTDDVCTAGVPSNPNKAQGTACGAGLVCDGNGACVGCNTPADCSGTDDECKARTCEGGVCGVLFTASGTPVSAQTAGDCLVAVCDGSGNVVAAMDDADLPADDGNACTDEVCNAGVPGHPAKA